MTPKLGQRYALNRGKGYQPTVYELVDVDPEFTYAFTMRLVSADPSLKRTPGEEMTVESNWFVHRSALPASSEGAVREVP